MIQNTTQNYREDKIDLSAFRASKQCQELKQLAKTGQRPIAIVIACSDSRVAPEIIFNTKIGELFVIRVAGNVIGSYELASIEYAALSLNVPVCYVIGHTNCGAVCAAVNYHQDKTPPATTSLKTLLKLIEPAVIKAAIKCKNHTESELIQVSIEQNVLQMVNKIRNDSCKLAHRIDTGQLSVKGLLFDIHTATLKQL